jgi:hypothetical protein
MTTSQRDQTGFASSQMDEKLVANLHTLNSLTLESTNWLGVGIQCPLLLELHQIWCDLNLAQEG